MNREPQGLLINAYEQSPISTWIGNETGTTIWQNEACIKLFGITNIEDVNGKYNLFQDNLLKEKGHLEEIRKVFSEGKVASFTIDYDVSKSDILEIDNAPHLILKATLFPLRDSNGQVTNIVVQHEDITDRELIKNELNTIFETSLDLICEADINTATFTKVNPAFTRVLGYSEEELLGRQFLDFVHPDDVTSTLDVIEQELKKGKKVLRFENRYSTKTGNYRWLDWTSSPNIDTGLTYAIARDVTERKHSEQYILKTSEILEMIAKGESASNIYDAIALMYEARHSGMRCSLLELKGNKLMHGGAPSLPKEYCNAVNGLENGPSVGSCGTSTYTGKRVLVENIETDPKWEKIKHVALPHGMRCCWSEPIKNSSGKVLGAFGMYYNHPALPNEDESNDLLSAARLAGIIMEREHTEATLHKSAGRYQGIFDESIATIYVFDGEKNFTDSNQAGLDLLGYTREELLKMSVSDVDADQGAVVPAHKHLLSGGRIVNFEHRLVHKDGHIITVLNNSRPLTDVNNNVIGMQSTLVNITERKESEEKAKKLSQALSRLVSLYLSLISTERLNT